MCVCVTGALLGVRIDLDEVHVSLTKIADDERVAFGRDMFTSVFDVISSNASSTVTLNLASSEIIRECTNILLSMLGQHVLKPSYLTGVQIVLKEELSSHQLP